MEIKRNYTIRGSSDSCTVSHEASGRIHVGSITVEDVNELDELGRQLQIVANQMRAEQSKG